MLAASGQAPRARLASHALFGELALDGEVHACRGTLAVAQAAADAGLACLVLASCEAHEARLVDDIEVAPVGTLRSAVRVLGGGRCDRLGRGAGERARRREGPARDPVATGVDLCEVRGQHHAVEATIIAGLADTTWC